MSQCPAIEVFIWFGSESEPSLSRNLENGSMSAEATHLLHFLALCQSKIHAMLMGSMAFNL